MPWPGGIILRENIQVCFALYECFVTWLQGPMLFVKTLSESIELAEKWACHFDEYSL